MPWWAMGLLALIPRCSGNQFSAWSVSVSHRHSHNNARWSEGLHAVVGFGALLLFVKPVQRVARCSGGHRPSLSAYADGQGSPGSRRCFLPRGAAPLHDLGQEGGEPCQGV
jgi:hypothetical protein